MPLVPLMSWYLRSLGDHDTHRGTYSITTRSVHAACGTEFEPLKQSNGAPIVLSRDPRDRDQICQECKHGGARR
jgi:hypothetical protein